VEVVLFLFYPVRAKQQNAKETTNFKLYNYISPPKKCVLMADDDEEN